MLFLHRRVLTSTDLKVQVSLWGSLALQLSAADIDRPTAASTNSAGFRPLVTADRTAIPVLAPASREAEARIRQFKLLPGLKVTLWAAEPMLANPVAFTVDERGRVFTSETYRYRTSALDIRHYMFMLEDDLASRSGADRLAVIRKWFGPQGEKQLGTETEVIRLLEDTDHDGRADKSTIFADGFSSPLSGIASGVLIRQGEVWVTEIPSLWRFTPNAPKNRLPPPADPALASRPRVHDDNFHAEELLRGWGVRFSLTGHDLHGLRFGPDGRLYFSVGDRGTHVATREGTTIDLPDEGAVFRCEPDGTHLEVVAHGLRNPQELAFNEFGDLFTGDNDSDQGDRERWVQVIEGMDAGWRVGHQHAPLGNAGMWNIERLWVPHFAGQAAYIIPPIANIGDGPSGLVHDYGTSLPAALRGRFLLAYFKGTSSKSGIYSIGLRPAGASYELIDHDEFIWNSLVPDLDLGPDGAIWFADWHEGWPKSNKGRIYRAWFPEVLADPVVAETQRVLAEGTSQRSETELLGWLSHRDQRVRQEAQFALAQRGTNSFAAFRKIAFDSTQSLARLHALWGIGQIVRPLAAGHFAAELESLIPLTVDPDAEVRRHVARLLGAAGVVRAQADLLALVADPQLRVVQAALQALKHFRQVNSPRRIDSSVATLTAPGAARLPGRGLEGFPGLADRNLSAQTVISPIRAVAAALDRTPKDIHIRQAAVGVLASFYLGLPPGGLLTEPLFQPGNSTPTHRRMAAVLALRELKDPNLWRLLEDSDPLVLLEAVRAIHDVDLAPAADGTVPMARLAELAEPAKLSVLLRQFSQFSANSTSPSVAAAGVIRDVRADQPLPWTNAPIDHLTPLLLRLIDANFRIGTQAAALRVATLATNADLPEPVRTECLFAISQWRTPAARDRITGLYRPLGERKLDLQPLLGFLPTLLNPAQNSEVILVAACNWMSAMPWSGAATHLESLLRNPNAPDRARAAALRPWVESNKLTAGGSSTASIREKAVTEMLAYAARSGGEGLRLEASRLNAELHPDDAVGQLVTKVRSGTQAEQQSAYVSLGTLKSDAADAVLAEALDRLMRREIAPEVTLELVEAAAQRTTAAVKDRLAAYQDWKLPKDHLSPYREALVGGDAARGRKIFYENAAVACTRCHQIGSDGGGNAGPRLDGVATRSVREYLLESIVFPNQQITPGFEAALITRKNGEVLAGTVRSETPTELVLINPEDNQDLRIPKSDIVSREKGPSGMPEGFATLLSRSELRDVMEFLGTLK